jgi:hypothetical protein
MLLLDSSRPSFNPKNQGSKLSNLDWLDFRITVIVIQGAGPAKQEHDAELTLPLVFQRRNNAHYFRQKVIQMLEH